MTQFIILSQESFKNSASVQNLMQKIKIIYDK